MTLKVLVDARRERLAADAKRRAEKALARDTLNAQVDVDVSTTKPS